ncbi:hypothetical protein [Virgibacillus ainsalahensis]
MPVINFENDVRKLTKLELGTALNLSEKEIHQTKKTVLVESFRLRYSDEVSQKRVYKIFSSHFSIPPAEVEDLLSISAAERKRWTSEGKLVVDHYESLTKWGRHLEYPMYDVYALSKLSKVSIDIWREEHHLAVRKNRQKAGKKSVETKRRNTSIQRNFYENEWKSSLRKWFKDNPELGATLQLAFWTIWVSRWAKEFQAKALRARTKGAEYNLKKAQLYKLKNESLELLMLSPYTELSLYRPAFPHKVFNLYFCPDHYNRWCDLREVDYIGKWDFFEMYQKDIEACSGCRFDKINDYYTLYHLSVNSNELGYFHFSFHTPYPIGKKFFPPKHELEKVIHGEQEGIFRFGRELMEIEKIIFTEKEVVKRFEEARKKYMLYFSSVKKA